MKHSLGTFSLSPRAAYMLALVIIMVLGLLSYTSLELLAQQQQSITQNIVEQTEQRLLIQRITLSVNLLLNESDAGARARARTELLQSLIDLEQTHQRLTTALDSISVLYYADLTPNLQGYVQLVQQIADMPDARLADQRSNIVLLIEQTLVLREQYTQIIDTYLQKSQKIESQIINQILAGLLLLPNLLVMIVLLIFRPMERRIEQAQAALRRSQELYRLLASNLPDVGVMVFDKELRFQIAEGPFLHESGYTRQTTEGRTLREVIPPERYNALLPYYQAALRGEDATLQGTSSKGQHYEAHFTPVKNETGQIVGGMFVSRNITRQIEAEKQIRDSASLFHSIVRNLPDAAVLLFDHNLRYIAAEGAFLARFLPAGLSLENKTLHEVVDSGTAQQILPYYQGALRGESGVLQGQQGSVNYEAHFAPVRDDDGRVLRGMVVLRDISRQLEAEKQVRDSEALFRQLIEHIEGVFWIVDVATRSAVYVSPTFERVFGVPPETLTTPEQMLAIVHPEDRQWFVASQLGVYAGGTHSFEYRIMRPDGEIRWLWAQAFPVHDEQGKFYRISGFTTDVTERKRAEGERQRVQVLADFMRDTSHDLRTPISVITTNLYLMRKITEREKLMQKIDTTERYVEYLSTVLEQMQLMARLDSISILALTPHPIVPMLEEVMMQIAPAAEQKQIRLSLEAAENLPQAPMDREQLRLALLELLTNALRFTPEGGTVLVKADTSDNKLRVIVQDSGIGISVQALPRIFERFFKVDDARTTGRGGGMGLPMARRIIELHHGDLLVQSTIGQGTCLTILLPTA